MRKYSLCIFLFTCISYAVPAQTIRQVAPGIWKVTFGVPEKHLPTDFKEKPLLSAFRKLPLVTLPFDLKSIRFSSVASGVLVNMHVDTAERFYGFGMQTNSFQQRGMRRDIRISSWVTGNVGFGHASMPFYISSKGYGILVNTARSVSFYMASKGKLDKQQKFQRRHAVQSAVALTTVDLYGKHHTLSHEVDALVRGTRGVELYVIAGPGMLDVVRRYNLFSGGGALPPLWALGFIYRTKATFSQQQVEAAGNYFREHHIPCDVIGLEPGWQTRSYSCSFEWNRSNFPDPEGFVDSMRQRGFKVNLWEHAYTHPSSPIYDSIVPYSGDYTVWTGAVPDFITAGARRVFGNYHFEHFVKKGIGGFKLDESDGANYAEAQREWSFPDIAHFPSGVDGIQMRQLFGSLYNRTLLDLYRKYHRRTFFDVRSSYLFAAPYATALYSDMYNHADFVRMIVNSAFAGVNWSPEVRETANAADLIRRLQTSLLSAHMVVNGWYLDLPPWLQYQVNKNVRHELLPDADRLEQTARNLIRLRMQLLPYLYAAFARYHFDGVPPFRPLVMDYPDDVHVQEIDDEYLMGPSLLCAPFIDSASTRTIYFPEGEWIDLNTRKYYKGGRSYAVTLNLDEIPVFVKNNSLLPLAEPVEYVTPQTRFHIKVYVFGNPQQPVSLLEDNSFDYEYEKGKLNWVKLTWDGKAGHVDREGNYGGRLYEVEGWNVEQGTRNDE